MVKKKYGTKPVITEFGQIPLNEFLTTLSRDGKIRIKGLGDFSLKKIKSRVGWNPIKRKKMEIPAYTKICFKADSRFKNYINQ